MLISPLPLTPSQIEPGIHQQHTGFPKPQANPDRQDVFVKKLHNTRFSGQSELSKPVVPEVAIPAEIRAGKATAEAWGQFSTQVGDAFRQSGFIAVTGAWPDTTEQVLDSAKEAFALSDDVKRSYQHPTYGWQRGWNAPNRNKKEIWNFGPGHNLFPDAVPTFQPAATRYFQQMEETAVLLIKALDTYYGANGRLTDLVVNPKTGQNWGTHMVTVNYNQPVTDFNGLPTTKEDPALYLRHMPHADWELLTLIPKPAYKGLQVMNPVSQQYEDVVVPPNALVVNLGKMAAAITANSDKPLPATLHRVVGTAKDMKTPRISAPFFVSPNYDAPLPDLGTDGVVIKDNAPMTAGAFLFNPSPVNKGKSFTHPDVQAEFQRWHDELLPLIQRT